jgi:hypothetical protein
MRTKLVLLFSITAVAALATSAPALAQNATDGDEVDRRLGPAAPDGRASRYSKTIARPLLSRCVSP